MTGFKITKADEALTVTQLFTVIYGYPGVGKTSLSFTSEGKVLHIDTDKGLRRAVQKVRPDSVQIDSWTEFNKWVSSKEFEAYVKSEGIRTVVLDTIGTLLDNVIAPALIANDPKMGTRTGGLALAGWGALKTTFSAFKNRLQSLGLNVVAISHAKESGGDTDRHLEFAISGGSSDILFQTADLIGYVYAQGAGSRFLDFNPSSLRVGKNVGNLPVMEIPNSDLPEYDNFLEGVNKACMDAITNQSKGQLELKEKLADWASKIDECCSPETFTKLSDEIALVPNGLLKTAVRNLFGKALTANRIKYDKDSAKYIAE